MCTNSSAQKYNFYIHLYSGSRDSNRRFLILRPAVVIGSLLFSRIKSGGARSAGDLIGEALKCNTQLAAINFQTDLALS
jgi:hypothetical protein